MGTWFIQTLLQRPIGMNVLSASQRDTQSNPARPSSCNGCTTTQPRLARSTGRAVFYALKARGSSPQPTPDWPIWKVVKKKKKEGRKREKALSFSCYFPFLVGKPSIYLGHKAYLALLFLSSLMRDINARSSSMPRWLQYLSDLLQKVSWFISF